MHKKPQKKIMEIEISKFTKLENFDKSGIYRIYVRMIKIKKKKSATDLVVGT